VKKWIAFALTALLLFSMLMPSVSASEFNLVRSKHYDLPLINAIANVQAVSGQDVRSVLTGDNAPGQVYVAVSELTDVNEFVKLCNEQGVVPTFLATTIKEATSVISAMEEAAFKDVTIVSPDAAVLKYVRNKKAFIRTGLEIALEKDTLTSKEAHQLRTQVRSAPATFCVIDDTFASRQAVAELQELAVAVWVKARDGDASVLKAVTSGANGIITANAYNTAVLLSKVLEKNSMTRTPIMIGHRGNPTQAPENSLSGFLKAYENGADVFELDVEITSDGEIVIMHDSTLNRTTDYSGLKTVNKMTLEEVKSHNLKGLDGKTTEESVPTLREVLEAFKDKDCRIFIEFKGYNQDNVPVAMALVKEFDMEDRVDVISFNASFLTQTQNSSLGMSTGFLQSPSGATMNELVALETFYSSIIKTNDANSTINPGKGVISKHYLQAATDRGMTVWPWTYNKSTANMAFVFCPDGITTDDVQWSKDMLKFIEADTAVQVSKGKNVSLEVNGTTYGGDTNAIATEDCVVTVLDGDDIVSLENGVLTALENGTAQVLVGYKTKTAGDSSYVLYAQPITVTVGGTATALIVLLAVAGAILIAGVIVATVLILRKRKA